MYWNTLTCYDLENYDTRGHAVECVELLFVRPGWTISCRVGSGHSWKDSWWRLVRTPGCSFEGQGLVDRQGRVGSYHVATMDCWLEIKSIYQSPELRRYNLRSGYLYFRFGCRKYTDYYKHNSIRWKALSSNQKWLGFLSANYLG